MEEGIFCNLVVKMATLGSRCFPQVYSVISRDTEGNSGLQPVSPMDSEALPTPYDSVDVGSEVAVVPRKGSEVDNDDNDDGDVERARRERSLVKEGRRRRVGYTIDMSVNLWNSSHFDVHDASQGLGVWTEDVPGCGANWFFVLPNVHGLKPDGVTKFRGMAVKLGHGVAINWDCRVIRHCTSVSHPDGMGCGRVGEVKDSHFRNHLYRTLTAAKERIVRVGRAQSAASDGIFPSVVDALSPRRKGEPCKPPKRRRKKKR